MATIFKSTGHAQFDKLLEKATSNLLLEPEWASIMQICDLIRQKDCQPKYAIAQLKKKLHHQNPHVSFYGLQVLESVVKNCGSPVHEEVAAKQFMEELRELAKTTHHENVREKILELIQTWAHAFRKISSYRAVQDVLNIMKTEGAKFPPLVEADAMFVADQAPDWADGECCHRCRVEFTFTQRKHHCRACGQIFCNKCSGKECTLPRFGIEKEVRVCDACFEKYGRDSIGPGGSSSGGTPSSSLDEHHMHMPTTRGSSGTAVGGSASNGLQAKGGIDSRGGGGLIGSSSSSSATSGSVGGVVGGGGGGDNKPSAKELELAEEEQLQLALAISQSEAEAKEQEMKARKARMYNTNALMSTITTTTTNNSKQAESIGARTTTTSPPRTQSPPDSSGGQNEDPELSRYLNRAYWENKSNDANAVMSGGVTTTNHTNNKTASISSNSNSSSSSSTFTPSAPLKLVSTNFGTVPAPAEIISTATQKIGPITEEDLTIDTFLDTLRTQIEMFVNRMKSNSSRGRPIANDTSVQSLFMSITHMHSQLLAYIQIQDNQRGRYEMLQDKLNQVRDARAALDDLRNEHAEALRRQQEEQERIRQYQMAQKLALMRQKKNEYLQYQRQLAMQRMQEQEREMQMRIAQQGVVGVVGGVPPQQQQQPASGGGGVQQPPQAQQWGTTPGHLPGYPPTHMGAQPGMYGMPPPQQQQQQQQPPPQAWPNQPPSVPAAPQQQQQIPMMSSPTTSGPPPQPTIPQQQQPPQGGQQQMMYGGGAPPPQPQPTGSDPNLHQAAQQQHSDPNLIMQQQVQQVQQQQPQPGEVLQQQQPVVSQPPQDLQAPQQQAPPPPAPQLQPPAAVAELISFD